VTDRGPEGIFSSLHSVMAEVGPVGKDNTNSFQNYKFRGISQVIEAVTPLLIKHRIIMLPQYGDFQLHPQDKGFTATCKLQLGFINVDDGTNAFVSTVGQGADSGDKAMNKAMTAAMKYALCYAFGIRENEVGTDGDADSPVVVPKTVKESKKASTPRNFLEG
jgi:hypothetical protein